MAGGVFQTKLVLNYSISVNDTVYIGENRSPATNVWYPNNLTKRFACTQNATIASSPVAVVLASGGGFRNLNYTNSTHNRTVEITQDYGSPFYIFAADTNCTRIIKNYPAIEDGRVAVMGSVPDVSTTGIVAWIPYARINITLPLSMPKGTWDLIVQNNGTARNISSVWFRLLGHE